MPMAKVTVACALPAGLLIDHEGRSVMMHGSDHPDAHAGFGLTHDVERKWFRSWTDYASAAGFPPVIDGLIFAQADDIERATEERAVEFLPDMPAFEPAVIAGAKPKT